MKGKEGGAHPRKYWTGVPLTPDRTGVKYVAYVANYAVV
jgi:hypothetical protein